MNLSRRDFVEQALLAATAALATGSGINATAAEDSQPERKVGPNEKLRVAVIGVNGQGGAHIGEWMKNPDVDLVAVCDCDPAAYQKHEAVRETRAPTEVRAGRSQVAGR